MFKKVVSIIVLIPFVFLSSGCCTIVRGNRQLVTINSEPIGAKVKIDGLRGTTPYTANLARNQDYVATVSKDGYEDQQVQVTKSFSAMAIFGNIFFLLIGAIVDFASGSAYNLNPTNVDVELEPA
ncbi:MAG: PEGA domain-containing protein [Candidatus Omnitrophica bacterium]|nr:PEGA domain-containing protein [Candidatus Omnitrophota bacterium]